MTVLRVASNFYSLISNSGLFGLGDGNRLLLRPGISVDNAGIVGKVGQRLRIGVGGDAAENRGAGAGQNRQKQRGQY